MPSIPTEQPNPGLAPTTTPLLVGFLMNCLLYGMLASQTYWYYMSFPKDLPRLKLLVVAIAVLETAQTTMVCHDALKSYALTFGSLSEFDSIHLASIDIPILTGIISLLVQSFFSWRIYSFSQNWIIVILIQMIALLQCGASFAVGAITISSGTYSSIRFNERARFTIGLWLAASAACDILIAVVMVFLLMRAPAHFQKTKVLVSRLIRLTIETGTITAVFAVIILVLFTMVGGSYYACLGVLDAKLYSNVALAVLNSRIQVIGGRDELNLPSTTLDLPVYVDGDQGLVFTRQDAASPSPSYLEVSMTRSRETPIDSKGKTPSALGQNAVLHLRPMPD